MLKIKSKITNPMTVIAIFAAISETSAAVSLPFLNNEDREVYVWFLISFPFYLLFLFFITLNFNYRSLYSPSDFDKDESFLKIIDNNHHDDKRDVSPCKIDNVSDPPPAMNVQAQVKVQHNIQLPAAISNLHVIDARDVDAPKELTTILEKIRRADKKTGRVLMFLSDHVSDGSLTKNARLQIRHAKKSSAASLCIVYNLRSRAVTLLGRA